MRAQLNSSCFSLKFQLCVICLGMLFFAAAEGLQCYQCMRDCSKPTVKDCPEEKNACFTQLVHGGGKATIKGCRTYSSGEMQCNEARFPGIDHCYCDTDLCNDLKHGGARI